MPGERPDDAARRHGVDDLFRKWKRLRLHDRDDQPPESCEGDLPHADHGRPSRLPSGMPGHLPRETLSSDAVGLRPAKDNLALRATSREIPRARVLSQHLPRRGALCQPRAQPWVRRSNQSQALKGRAKAMHRPGHNARSAADRAPFQGLGNIETASFPRAMPWAVVVCPFRAEVHSVGRHSLAYSTGRGAPEDCQPFKRHLRPCVLRPCFAGRVSLPDLRHGSSRVACGVYAPPAPRVRRFGVGW